MASSSPWAVAPWVDLGPPETAPPPSQSQLPEVVPGVASGRQIELAILDRVEASSPSGVPMGSIVDALILQGATEQESEEAIWRLMQQRRLTPNGFVRRVVRRRTEHGTSTQRTYEFVLVAWDPSMDHQLDLELKRR